MNITKEIIKWYQKHKRDLPWRNTRDPYLIWVSEVILQQTRVEQGMQYYYRITERFPDVNTLAQADEEEVLKLWQGLGYYSRARNLHHAAKQIANDFNGVFPSDINDLRQLKGIGEYTAAAILSFCFSKPFAVIDGNVYRVLSRIFGISAAVNSGKSKIIFREAVYSLLDKNDPGLFNQAIMEFGALQCKPGKPDCSSCPVRRECVAASQNDVLSYPVKMAKNKIRTRYFNYLLIERDEHIYMVKRTSDDIWKNLYDLPLIETESAMKTSEIVLLQPWKELFGNSVTKATLLDKEQTHKLSHQHIEAFIWKIELKNSKKSLPFLKIHKNDIDNYPVSRLFEKFSKNFIRDLHK